MSRKRGGSYLKPKVLVLDEFRELRPVSKVPPSLPVFNVHETLPRSLGLEHIDEVELPDMDLTNIENVTLRHFIKESQLPPEDNPEEED